ncbi:ABC transporter transmembrane domain-containing protein [Nonomuraea africana]|uniref:ABC transport system ATP-binding protein n=1 Tax=Nonomuraea africana TaxID=46171 RepID=A0ABR9K7M2_9ACTN|nr:ABC transporter ATP-binding protein [Nonomuraea africana]MBE1558002.1 putative ABC transport system ATP-binding protein [Nonomuraea africana]
MSINGRDVLRRAITGQWKQSAAGALLAAGHQTGEALVPVLVGVVIDEAISPGDGGALLLWIAALAVVFAGLSSSYRFSFRAAERASEQAAHRLRIELTERVLEPRGGAETGRLPGELVTVATSDAKRVGAVNVAMAAAVAALAGLLAGGVALLRVSVPLGLLVLLGIPPLLMLAHLLGKPLERRSGAEQERAARASGVAADLIAGLRVLKGIGAERAAVERYRLTSRDALAATLRAARAQAWHDGGMLVLTGVFIAVVALLGGRLAAQGDISVGQLVAAVGLAQFLLTPLSILAWANGELAQGRASAARIASVLSSPPAVTGGSDAPSRPVRGAIALREVSYGALRGVSFEAAPGELLGVVTRDAAAAHALLRVLGRAADPDSGVVELDGVPLTRLEPAELRRAIVVADHDADLFEGTLLDNITAAASKPPEWSSLSPDPTVFEVTVPETAAPETAAPETAAPETAAPETAAPETTAPGATVLETSDPETLAGVGRAMAAAAADEVAAALPYGELTPLTERGLSLSGGQRQRVALARALAADPPVLVLHDPTTAVDAATEARIAEGIRAVREGRTTIMVVTSPALLAAADRVVFVDGGGPLAHGTHAELVHDHDAYRATVLT